MLSKTRSAPAHSPATGATAETTTEALGNGPRIATPDTPSRPSATTDRETRRDRSRRKAHRSRLHGYAILAVALVAFLIALAASNTAHVKVNWVFGSSHVSLVWLVLFAAILGWMLGLAATATFHWRTRGPRRDGQSS